MIAGRKIVSQFQLIVTTALVLVIATAGVSQAVFASSGAVVTGDVQVCNAGELTLGFEVLSPAIMGASGENPRISSTEGDYAQILISAEIVDTRAEGVRSPYSIVLGVSDLISGRYFISNSNLSVVGVSALPTGFTTVNGTNSLVQPLPVITSSPNPIAGEYEITIEVSVLIPAGSYPGDYTAEISLALQFQDEFDSPCTRTDSYRIPFQEDRVGTRGGGVASNASTG